MRSTKSRKLIKNRKRKISKGGKRKLSKGGKRKLSKRIRGGSQQNYSNSKFYRLMTALDNINIEKATRAYTFLKTINIDKATRSYKYLKEAEQVIKLASDFDKEITYKTGVSPNTGSSIVYPESDARLKFGNLLNEKEEHIKELLSKL